MEKYFSMNFRNERKKKGLTQEQIAEVLNISYQAVSKWETAASLPDISMLVVIADYFGVSIDYLLGYDMGKQAKEIDETIEIAKNYCDQGEYGKAVPILREALGKHPANERLMYQLAYALSGTLKESPENYNEAILLYQKILEFSINTELRAKVCRDLIYRYYTKGEDRQAFYYVEQLPTFEVCKEYNLGRSNLLQGEELAAYLKRNIALFGKALIECLEYYVDADILTDQEKKPYDSNMVQQYIEEIKRMIC